MYNKIFKLVFEIIKIDMDTYNHVIVFIICKCNTTKKTYCCDIIRFWDTQTCVTSFE